MKSKRGCIAAGVELDLLDLVFLLDSLDLVELLGLLDLLDLFNLLDLFDLLDLFELYIRNYKIIYIYIYTQETVSVANSDQANPVPGQAPVQPLAPRTRQAPVQPRTPLQPPAPLQPRAHRAIVMDTKDIFFCTIGYEEANFVQIFAVRGRWDGVAPLFCMKSIGARIHGPAFRETRFLDKGLNEWQNASMLLQPSLKWLLRTSTSTLAIKVPAEDGKGEENVFHTRDMLIIAISQHAKPAVYGAGAPTWEHFIHAFFKHVAGLRKLALQALIDSKVRNNTRYCNIHKDGACNPCAHTKVAIGLLQQDVEVTEILAYMYRERDACVNIIFALREIFDFIDRMVFNKIIAAKELLTADPNAPSVIEFVPWK